MKKGKTLKCAKFVKLLESFERDPNETKIKLRIQLGLAGKFLFYLINSFLTLFHNFNSFHSS